MIPFTSFNFDYIFRCHLNFYYYFFFYIYRQHSRMENVNQMWIIRSGKFYTFLFLVRISHLVEEKKEEGEELQAMTGYHDIHEEESKLK